MRIFQLFYPFCISHEEEITDFVIQQFLLASYKAFTWTPKAKTVCLLLTLKFAVKADFFHVGFVSV